jgi:hypothetical protein
MSAERARSGASKPPASRPAPDLSRDLRVSEDALITLYYTLAPSNVSLKLDELALM